MRTLKTFASIFTMLLLFCSLKTFSQTPSNKKFVQDAATISMNQVALGNLGQRRLSNPDLKEYALNALNDHMVASAQLKALAKKKKIALPDLMGVPINSMQTRPDSVLSKTPDSLNQNFDSDYINMMVNDNKKAISLFEEGASSTDKEIKNFATKYLKIYKKHLKEALAIQDKSSSVE